MHQIELVDGDQDRAHDIALEKTLPGTEVMLVSRRSSADSLPLIAAAADRAAGEADELGQVTPSCIGWLDHRGRSSIIEQVETQRMWSEDDQYPAVVIDATPEVDAGHLPIGVELSISMLAYDLWQMDVDVTVVLACPSGILSVVRAQSVLMAMSDDDDPTGGSAKH
jgi:hypothetical protein